MTISGGKGAAASVLGAAVPFTVDPWDPAYGQAFSEGQDSALDDSTAELVLDFEVPAADWRPVDPDTGPSLPRVVVELSSTRWI